MTRVVIESPYAGEVERNIGYAKRCLLDSLRRGEAPFASHLLYTLVLDDDLEEQREQGITAGFTWLSVADLCAVYTDLGMSGGMARAVERARKTGVRVEFRRLTERA